MVQNKSIHKHFKDRDIIISKRLCNIIATSYNYHMKHKSNQSNIISFLGTTYTEPEKAGENGFRTTYTLEGCVPVAMVAAMSGGAPLRYMGYCGSCVSPRMARRSTVSFGRGSSFTRARRCSELGSTYCGGLLCRYLS